MTTLIGQCACGASLTAHHLQYGCPLRPPTKDGLRQLKPRYRWSSYFHCWVLQGLHRWERRILPSRLLPALPKVDRYRLEWVK